MASADGRSPEAVRQAIEAEREELAAAVADLRGSLGFSEQLREKLPVVAVGAVGLGFVLGGGIGATMRLLARRGREGDTKARLGRFAVVERD